jgi:hypothetical protein
MEELRASEAQKIESLNHKVLKSKKANNNFLKKFG